MDYLDHRLDPAGWARELGVSVHACSLLLDADFVDLCNGLDLATRLFGYRPERHHGVARRAPVGTGHTDFPRLREASLTGVVQSLVTNPVASGRGRVRATFRRVEEAVARVRAHPEEFTVVVDHPGYVRARASGRTAVFVALSGAEAVANDLRVLDGPLGQQIHRIGLVNLTRSSLGGTARPNGYDDGLTELGHSFLAACHRGRILVDLAYAGDRTFRDVVGAHDPDLPFVVSSAGAQAVHPHWSNLTDDQVRDVADRGGVVGVPYDGRTLAKVRASASRADLVAHLEHLQRVGGDAVAALGSAYDSGIVPPHDLADVTHHPQLVQDLLDRGWSEDRIRGVLGRNYLDVVKRTRPGVPRLSGG